MTHYIPTVLGLKAMVMGIRSLRQGQPSEASRFLKDLLTSFFTVCGLLKTLRIRSRQAIIVVPTADSTGTMLGSSHTAHL